MMKVLKITNLMFCLIINLALIYSCSDDDGAPKASCNQEDNRSIVSTVSEVVGTMTEVDICGFVIEPDEPLEHNPVGLLKPCNLDQTFEVEGMKVVFSGYIFESFETEDICADFFELTEIRQDGQ